ncbi:MAG: MBL fold metallo-hydrolase [Candidatus Portnoybacteria bacterium]|nr:MBL fold metallo-hydrolase [Candidatus Portnoybacteria bacterium]
MKLDFKKYLILLFIIIAIIIFSISFYGQEKDVLEIDFFDIGQGDSIFIELNKKQVLIDGGPGMKVLEKLGREMPFYDRHIDFVILTHPEYDHINGLIEVIKRYNIGAVLVSGLERETMQYKEWSRVIKEKNIPVIIVKNGDKIAIDDAVFYVIHPFHNLKGEEVKKTNNASIVGKLVYGDFEILLTGDIEKAIERELVDSGIDLRADVLKVAHHGSSTSSCDEFLNAVGSIAAVIQAGKDNRYGHPHPIVLERLGDIFVKTTGEHGDIELISDGIGFLIR